VVVVVEWQVSGGDLCRTKKRLSGSEGSLHLLSNSQFPHRQAGRSKQT